MGGVLMGWLGLQGWGGRLGAAGAAVRGGYGSPVAL